ncbi:MAG: ParB N-terminal domain-containing protein, partial [Patescibacteria group bacterium]
MKLMDLKKLRSHERTDSSKLKEVFLDLYETGILRQPVLVDEKNLIILDGHHRVKSLKMLGCKIVPAIMIDYNGKKVKVESFSKTLKISKKMVRKAALLANLLPPKTSKHIYNKEVFVNYPLDLLK